MYLHAYLQCCHCCYSTAQPRHLPFWLLLSRYKSYNALKYSICPQKGADVLLSEVKSASSGADITAAISVSLKQFQQYSILLDLYITISVTDRSARFVYNHFPLYTDLPGLTVTMSSIYRFAKFVYFCFCNIHFYWICI